MYEYQKKRRFFAQTALDIIDLAETELRELGARETEKAYGGIFFNADNKALYKINYASRLASRVLAPLVSFRCTSTDELYKNALGIKWSDFISANNTFAVFSNVSNSKITNSHYASLKLKDAIADSFRRSSGKRPGVDPRDPYMWLNLHIRGNRAVISLDTSGGSLHRRGYRKDAVEAPMQETVAAAVIKYSCWDGSVPLYDPMCGSGTLLSEALMHYCRIPSGIFRDRFGFELLPDHDVNLWKTVREKLDSLVRELPEGYIAGSDLSSKAVKISGSNIRGIQYGERVRLRTADFRKLEGLRKGIIITNPPYGIRTGKKHELDILFKELGDFLKKKCKGSTAYIYFGGREFIKKIGLKPSWKKPLKTGGLDGRLVKYELF